MRENTETGTPDVCRKKNWMFFTCEEGSSEQKM
jgi:hypothetical protein